VEEFPHAYVLYAQLDGYTELISSLAPQRALEEMNEIVGRLDEAAERHGEDQSSRAGLPRGHGNGRGAADRAGDAGDRLLAYADELLRAVQGVSRDRQIRLQVRIGVDSGPVVGATLGLVKLTYDLWGEPVDNARELVASCPAVPPSRKWLTRFRAISYRTRRLWGRICPAKSMSLQPSARPQPSTPAEHQIKADRLPAGIDPEAPWLHWVVTEVTPEIPGIERHVLLRGDFWAMNNKPVGSEPLCGSPPCVFAVGTGHDDRSQTMSRSISTATEHRSNSTVTTTRSEAFSSISTPVRPTSEPRTIGTASPAQVCGQGSAGSPEAIMVRTR
jgi:class 3 adenylate cyclase